MRMAGLTVNSVSSEKLSAAGLFLTIVLQEFLESSLISENI